MLRAVRPRSLPFPRTSRNIAFSRSSAAAAWRSAANHSIHAPSHAWPPYARGFASASVQQLSSDEIQRRVVDIATKYAKAGSTITPEGKLEELDVTEDNENRKWDCLDTVEFLLDVEKEFGITIPDEIQDSIQTVKETVVQVEKLQSAEAKPAAS
ncbi:unnamed protein product [Vitrella brassicaformis CCMP3155]|uniref:Carrier domain-containing protein n=2 Tax=Vitrella brassicaformis TaxID=1169539 RepID=A0A0G4G0Z1_VITBC|nr:unnamed protein product [Vitrella brassicaformis CCMP3155]|eukprot:CEM21745.1 unnamed protein product [Vitrella brassicaformis CCMP3155]